MICFDVFQVYSFMCHICSSVYKQKMDYTFHMSAIHGYGGVPTCERCGKTGFRSRSTFVRHRRVCHASPEAVPVALHIATPGVKNKRIKTEDD